MRTQKGQRLHDIDAIDLAGIPIVAWQGANGGILIAEGYKTDKSVLTSDEMLAIITSLKGAAKGVARTKLYNS